MMIFHVFIRSKTEAEAEAEAAGWVNMRAPFRARFNHTLFLPLIESLGDDVSGPLSLDPPKLLGFLGPIIVLVRFSSCLLLCIARVTGWDDRLNLSIES